MLVSCTVQPRAMAPRTANLIASALGTGNAPGKPRHTGHTLLLGGSPNVVRLPQNILVRVRSWTCTSKPITVSHAISAPRPGHRRFAPAPPLPRACAPPGDMELPAGHRSAGLRSSQPAG